MIRASTSTPSVNAAGPGYRISGEGISKRRLFTTAGMCSHPGRAHLGGTELFATPGTDDDVRCAPCDLLRVGEDAVFRQGCARLLRKTILAVGDRDQLRNPADAADHGLVPLLEVDARAAPQGGGCGTDRFQMLRERGDQFFRLLRHADQGAERADHAQSAGDVTLVGHAHLNTGMDQLARCRPADRKNRARDRAPSPGSSGCRRGGRR
jgi:hypothetical protein